MTKLRYGFTGETKVNEDGYTLHRIWMVGRGKGGWIESKENLPHEGNGWVEDEAEVYMGAVVSGYAKVKGRAKVFGNAIVTDNSLVEGKAKVGGFSHLCGETFVMGDAQIMGGHITDATISEKALVTPNGGVLVINGNVSISDKACVRGNANISCPIGFHRTLHITGESEISGEDGTVILQGGIEVKDKTSIKAQNGGAIFISGSSIFCGNTEVQGQGINMTLKSWWNNEKDEPCYATFENIKIGNQTNIFGRVIGIREAGREHDPVSEVIIQQHSSDSFVEI